MLRLLTSLVTLPVLCFSLVLTGCTQPSDGPFVAGTQPLKVAVAALPDDVPAQVWYPAPVALGERHVIYTSAYWGQARRGAAVSGGAHYPLVLLAHGWRGSRFDLAWIAEALARRGFVVASLNSVGADSTSWSNAQAPKLWFRAHLLRRLIDSVAQDPRFADVVDTSSVAVIGHSAGGSTALVLGGATLDAKGFAETFPESAPLVDGDWSDPRIRAVITLNPGTGPAFRGDGIAKLAHPTLILSGSGDTTAPERTNAQYYAEHLPHAEWHSLPDVDHYTFMPMCSVYARARHFATCAESHPNVDRAAVHKQSLAYITDFLQRTLNVQPLPAGAQQL
jgi:predicted dienelactone hydrolase